MSKLNDRQKKMIHEIARRFTEADSTRSQGQRHEMLSGLAATAIPDLLSVILSFPAGQVSKARRIRTTVRSA